MTAERIRDLRHTLELATAGFAAAAPLRPHLPYASADAGSRARGLLEARGTHRCRCEPLEGHTEADRALQGCAQGCCCTAVRGPQNAREQGARA